MVTSTARRVGLAVLAVLSVVDIATLALTDGDRPPYAIAAVAAFLGVASLVLVVRAFREPAAPVRLLIGLRILSAVTALPAFVVSDVPVAAQAGAAAIVVLTAVGVVLTAQRSAEAVA
jgi:hypothetical protein